MINELDGMELAEYNVLVRMDPVQTKTPGGLDLPEEYVARKELEQDRGTLVRCSPAAFNYVEWPDDKGPPLPGERVLVAMFDGKLHTFGGVKYRVVKDKSVVAWWPAEEPVALSEAA